MLGKKSDEEMKGEEGLKKKGKHKKKGFYSLFAYLIVCVFLINSSESFCYAYIWINFLCGWIPSLTDSSSQTSISCHLL